MEFVPRTWRFNNRWNEGGVRLTRSARTAEAEALMGLSAAEPAVTGIERSLVSGSWFESNWESSVILSRHLAESLGIAWQSGTPPGDGESPRVVFFGREWTVRGVFDAEAYESIRDLNDEPLTPVHEARSSRSTLSSSFQVAGRLSGFG